MAPLGHALVSTVSCTQMQLRRTRENISRDPQDSVFICLQLSGTCHLIQDGRDAKLDSGDLCILTTRRPYTVVCPTDANQLVLTIAGDDLAARAGALRRLTALRVDSSEGAGGLAFNFIRMLPKAQAALSEAAQRQIANQAIDLAALALSERTGLNGVRLSSTAMLALHRLKAAVDTHLADANVRCADIAQTAGMSVRYANLLLAKEGTSLERYLQTRRLERCRAAFLDPRQNHRSSSEIGYGWGFKNAGHFTRAFKSAYGLPPGEFRNTARR